ncbi:NBPF family member NBPF4 [Saimiri boliviensis]|uniref:NBPF family member NBPF4 n=1 Tax=Saimiri boliviensis TaxID=27679 RepID=UPI003D777A4A
MNILETNQKLCSQLAESQQQFEDLKEKFLTSQATAYSLAKQLKKYECEEDKDIIHSALRDEVQFIEEKLAEKLRTEMKILEINQELRSQLAESQQQLADVKEKFLISQATADSLAKQLNKHECEEDKDIMDSLLRDEVQFIEEKLAEKLRQIEKLRAEMEFLEILQEESQLQLKDIKEKFLRSQAMADSLAKHLKKYECEEDKDIIVSALRHEIQFTEEMLAVKLRQTEELRAEMEMVEIVQEESQLQLEDVKEKFLISQATADSLAKQLKKYERDKDEDKDVTDEEVEKVQESAPLRLSQELPEVKELEAPEDSLDEIYLTPSVQHDLSDCHQPDSGTLSYLDDQFTCCALDVASPTQETCPQGTCSGDLSHYLSEVQASQTQLEPNTLVPVSLGLQLDQGIDCGNGLARQGLSTTCSFTANPDSGTQCPFQELVLEPSVGMKNPPQLEGDALEGSADNTQGHHVTGCIHASSVLKPKMIKRKLWFSKWIPRPSCLGRRELVVEPSVGMKNPPQLGGDAVEGSADNTQGNQVIGHIHASSVLKPKAIKRKLRFSKWIPRPSCLGRRGTI